MLWIDDDGDLLLIIKWVESLIDIIITRSSENQSQTFLKNHALLPPNFLNILLSFEFWHTEKFIVKMTTGYLGRQRMMRYTHQSVMRLFICLMNELK